MNITLTKLEQLIAKLWAKMVLDSNNSAGTAQKIDRNRTDYELDLDGLGAELAFCKMFNIYPDLSVYVREKGADALLKNGLYVDVKANRYVNNAHLVVNIEKRKDRETNVYALMVGQFPSYRFAGWVGKDELMTDENLTDWGNGFDNYSLHETKLKKGAIND